MYKPNHALSTSTLLPPLKKVEQKKSQIWIHLSQRWIVTHFSFCHSFLDPKGHISLHSPILHLFLWILDSRSETPSDATSEGLGLGLPSTAPSPYFFSLRTLLHQMCLSKIIPPPHSNTNKN